MLKEIVKKQKLKNNNNKDNNESKKEDFEKLIKNLNNKSSKNINNNKMNELIINKNNPPPKGSDLKNTDQYFQTKSSERNIVKNENFSDFNKESTKEICKEIDLSGKSKIDRMRRNERSNLFKEGTIHDVLSSRENFIKFNNNINICFDNKKNMSRMTIPLKMKMKIIVKILIILEIIII